MLPFLSKQTLKSKYWLLLSLVRVQLPLFLQVLQQVMVQWLVAFISYFRSEPSRGDALQKAVSPISPHHHQLAPDSSEMWAAITRNSSSPQCQHFLFGALTNLWALEGGGGCENCRGKDGVPRAGLLQFNTCHCGALCQLHKQAAISTPCIFCPFMVDVWEARCTFFKSFI